MSHYSTRDDDDDNHIECSTDTSLACVVNAVELEESCADASNPFPTGLSSEKVGTRSLLPKLPITVMPPTFMTRGNAWTHFPDLAFFSAVETRDHNLFFFLTDLIERTSSAVDRW